MNYSTTNLSDPRGGAFSAISCPAWWGICRFLRAIKTNPHLYPGVGWVGVYFDWCITVRTSNSVSKRCKPFNRLSPKSGKRKRVNMQVTAIFLMQDMLRNVLPKFIVICQTSCWSPPGWPPKWWPKTNINICHWVLLQKREFISPGTQEHWNNTFPKTWTVQVVKFREISHFFNQHNSSLGRHVNAASGKSLEIQA